MTQRSHSPLHLRRYGVTGSGTWCISASGAPAPDEQRQAELAGRTFERQPDAASLSFTSRGTAVRMPGGHWRAPGPVPGQWFLNGGVGDLVGFATEDPPSSVSTAEADGWVNQANVRGLAHLWHTGLDSRARAGQSTAVTSPAGQPVRSGLSVGIDAAWLMAGESGAQVFVIEMLLALVARAEIDRVVLLSEQGLVPSRLQGVPKIEGRSWAAALSQPGSLVDILHRPYQPDDQVDFARYRQVGRCVVLTVLDFIAYDIPSYHESRRAWHRHRRRFDEHVGLADGVLAISQAVADRVDSQYAGGLGGAARAVLLGADHLTTAAVPAEASPRLLGLADQPFLVVLGNDFAHKNRDFAVRVFATLCDRGYQGRLVLAGFHLDLGSSYGYEMAGAGAHQSRVVRFGSVTAEERDWLLGRADVVMYPTCVEGFGLVPFEAAALGTPTAFVRFGPLAETMPAVEACDEWRVVPFADLVERLRREPERHVAGIRKAAERLTWDGHAARVIDEYQELLAAAPGRRRRPLPGPAQRAWRRGSEFAERLTAAMARRAGRALRFQSA